MTDDAHLAERLSHLMHMAGQEALLLLGNELKARIIAEIPVDSPPLDPDPSYALKDHVEVHLAGNFAFVSVEGAYVIKQHERLSFKHPRGGQAKFVERPAVLMAAKMPGTFAGTVRRTFQTGKSFETGV